MKQYVFVDIPVTGGVASDELNHFLRSVRVLTVHREFVGQAAELFGGGANAFSDYERGTTRPS